MKISKLALPICLIIGLGACSSLDLARTSDLPEMQGLTPESVHEILVPLLGQPTYSSVTDNGVQKEVFVYTESNVVRTGDKFRKSASHVSYSHPARNARVGHNNKSQYKINRYKCKVEAFYEDGVVKTAYSQPRGCFDFNLGEATDAQS